MPRLLLGALVVSSQLRWSTVSEIEPARWPVSFVLWGLAAVFVLRRPGVWQMIRHPAMAWLLAFAVWAFIAATWSPELLSSFAFGTGILVSVLFAAAYVDSYGWPSFAAVVAVATAVFIGGGYIYSLVVESVPTNVSGRLIALSNNPTRIGFAATLMVLCGLSGFRRAPGFVLVLGTIGISTLALAQARMAAVALLIGVLLMVAAGRRGALRALAVIGLVLAVAAAGVLMFSTEAVPTQLARQEDAQDLQTFTGRDDLWRAAAKAYPEEPIVGHGLQSAPSVYEQLQRNGDIEWDARDAHNVVIQTLLELGLVGGLLLAAVTVTHTLDFRGLRAPGPLAVSAAILVGGLTETLLHEPSLTLLVLAGSCAGAAAATRQSGLPISARSPKPVGAEPNLVTAGSS